MPRESSYQTWQQIPPWVMADLVALHASQWQRHRSSDGGMVLTLEDWVDRTPLVLRILLSRNTTQRKRERDKNGIINVRSENYCISSGMRWRSPWLASTYLGWSVSCNPDDRRRRTCAAPPHFNLCNMLFPGNALYLPIIVPLSSMYHEKTS